MVARPPVRLSIGPMTILDLPAVHEIERASFTTPWPSHAYRTELETNRLAQYVVVRAAGRVIAFAGMWLMVDEAHVTTFAVAPAWRRRHIGERLILALLDLAIGRGAREATLEVRLSNLPARRLYEKYGFRPVGIRPRYYSDDNEDALIMTTPRPRRPGDGDAARHPAGGARGGARTGRARRLGGRSGDRGRARRGGRMSGRGPLSGDPRARPPARRDARCWRSSRPATRPASRSSRAGGGSSPRRSASQVALHAATGGIVPEVAARAHLRWIVPALDEVLDAAGLGLPDLDGVAVTAGPGLAGALLVGVSFAKALAWAHDLPLVSVNHLEGHLYAAWLLDPGEAWHAEPPFPLVALVVSGGHTFLVEMRGHLDYRLLGETVDDAAGEAFDKAGRLLGLGYPGGPAISAAAAEATRSRGGPAACLAGGHVRLQLLGPQDRPPPAGRGRARGGRATARRVGRAARPDPGGRARMGVPAGGRRRARGQDRARGRVDRRAVDRDGRRRRVERRAPRAARSRGGRPGHPAAGAAARAVHGQRGDDRRGRRPALRGGGARRPRPRRPAGLAARATRRRARRPAAAPPRAAARDYAAALAAERDAAGSAGATA